MAAFGFGKATSIHTSCQRRKLGLTHVPSLAQSPEHEADAVRHLFVMIASTAEPTVNRDDQIFQSERPVTAGARAAASSASWVLASSAMRARDRLAVAY